MAGYVYRGNNPPESRGGVGRPATFRPELCGTTAGWNQHYRRKEKRCDPCTQARREYDAEYKARKKAESVWETKKLTAKIGSAGQKKSGPGSATNTNPGPDH